MFGGYHRNMGSQLKLFLAERLCDDKVGSVKVMDLYQQLGGKMAEGVSPGGRFIEFLEKGKVGVKAFWEFGYPERLNELERKKPAMLFCRGDIGLVERISKYTVIAIVGARKITEYSRDVIRELFSWSGKEAGKTIYLSGLAYGVDAEIHKVALNCGIKTIAVVAGGIDNGFPAGNRGIYNEIVKNGLVISEFPKRNAIFKGMFPMRNRIIAALADKVVLVQASEDSGALSTAKWAKSLGKEVYVVPGSIVDKRFSGSSNLIQGGEKTLVSREQFRKISGFVEQSAEVANAKYSYLGKTSSVLLEQIEKMGGKASLSDINKMAIAKRLTACHELHTLLTNLELQGILRLTANGKYELKNAE